MKTTLTCWSNEGHLSQIYAGLALLHRQKSIDLVQHIVSPPAPNLAGPPHLKQVRNWHCQIETDRRLYVDVHDGDEICPEGLAWCDVYLKRGFNTRLSHHPKVVPLGLNYQVYASGFDPFEYERRKVLKGTKAAFKYAIKRPLSVKALHAAPHTGKPRVLFLCRAWEPEENRSADKNAERKAINEMRADCIRALRKRFGSLCTAGFAFDAYSLKHFRDELVPDPRMSDRSRYLKLVRSTPICIATMGLHESNGWKLGEYVAHSRAIVSEQLRHESGLIAGTNYLPFKNAVECVEAVGQLMESTALRSQMAHANQEFYQRYLRPDRFMIQALSTPESLRLTA